MTYPLSVHIDSDAPEWTRALVASLPASLRLAQAGEARIALISGVDWPNRAILAIEAGADCVQVIEPVLANVSAVERLASVVQRTAATLKLSEGFAGNAVISITREWLASGEFTNLAVTGSGNAALAQLIFEQIRIARSIGFTITATEEVAATPDAAIVNLRGTIGNTAATLRMVSCRTGAIPAQHVLVAQGPAKRVQLMLPVGWTARPAIATYVDSDGLKQAPSIYETAHRAVLRSIVAQTRNTGSGDLDAWMADAALARLISGSR